MVSNGDASTYKSILSLNNNTGPYGLSHPLKKEERRNHLHKRIGSRLFSLKRSMQGKKETSTGKVQFRSTLHMTDNTIKALQMYYLAAVNKHIGGSWKDLKLDIISIYFHGTSTDAEPRHSLCSEKWCIYLQHKSGKCPTIRIWKLPLDVEIKMS